MNKELKVLKIMKEDKCCWEEAAKKEKEIKNLDEYI